MNAELCLAPSASSESNGCLLQLAYVSSAVPLLTTDDLSQILARGRDKNRRLGITGLLLYKAGNILQVLEGEAEAVLRLFNSILNDPRHTGVIKLYTKPIATRDFAAWSMAHGEFPDVSREALNGSHAAKLILDFKASFR